MRAPILGLSGYAGAGKDTAALGLVERGWVRAAFADALKLEAIANGWNGRKDKEGREFLQTWGVARREEDPLYWVKPVLRLQGRYPLVVPDVRFENEKRAIELNGGGVLRIERPGVGPVNEHVSESELAVGRYPWPVEDIVDNDSTPYELHQKVCEWARARWPEYIRP